MGGVLVFVVFGAAVVAAQPGGPPLPARIPEALAEQAGACRSGELRTCYDVGVRYQTGDGVRRDFRTAAALFGYACDGGDTYACNGLGRLHENGQGVARDAARAVALYRRACDGGDTPVCYYIGWLHANGHLVAPDVDEARRFYRLACDHSYADACAALELPPVVPAAELRAQFARFVSDAGRAAINAARGRPHDSRFDGPDATRDLRATARSPALSSEPRLLATVWLFELSEHVDDIRYVRLQLMAFVFPDGRLRWAVAAERRSGRADRALFEGTLIDLAPAHLRWPLRSTESDMVNGRCDAIEAVTAADAAALPAPVQRDVSNFTTHLRESCRLARGVQGAQLLPSSAFLTAFVEQNGRLYQVATDVNVSPDDGRVSLAPAVVEEMR